MYNRITLFLVLCSLIVCASCTQSLPDIEEKTLKVLSIEQLNDQNYSFEQVLQDSTLPFVANDTIQPNKAVRYIWLRYTVQNYSKYSNECYALVRPIFENTLYFYDNDQKKWVMRKGGLTAARVETLLGVMPCRFAADTTSLVYIKTNVTDIAAQPYPTNADLYLQKTKFYTDKLQFINIVYWFTILILFLFILYSSYFHFILKEPTYRYYLLVLAGGIIYITCMSHYIYNFTDFRWFKSEVHPNGNVYYSDFSDIILEIGILFVIVGLIQFTRSYLDTKTLLPKHDTALKYITVFFVAMVTIPTFYTFSGISYLHDSTAFYENVSIVLIMLYLLYIGFLAYRKGYKAAFYYLCANGFTLLILVAIAGNYIFFPAPNVQNILPNIAIILQALSLAVALVGRVNLIKAELQAQKIATALLQSENERISLQNQVIALENERVVLENERINAERALQYEQQAKLEEKLAFNQRELASATMYLYRKNEILTDLQKQIARLPQIAAHATSVKLINTAIQNNIYLDADWNKFKVHFEQVHPNFFNELHEKHPNLTNNEIRLSAYLHLKLSTKEIAAMLNINPESVLKAKMRLNKKING